jgi:hypothetical protein
MRKNSPGQAPSFELCPNFKRCSTKKDSENKQPRRISDNSKPRPKTKTEIHNEKVDERLDKIEATNADILKAMARIESKENILISKAETTEEAVYGMTELLAGYSARYTKINEVKNYLISMQIQLMAQYQSLLVPHSQLYINEK